MNEEKTTKPWQNVRIINLQSNEKVRASLPPDEPSLWNTYNIVSPLKSLVKAALLFVLCIWKSAMSLSFFTMTARHFTDWGWIYWLTANVTPLFLVVMVTFKIFDRHCKNQSGQRWGRPKVRLGLEKKQIWGKKLEIHKETDGMKLSECLYPSSLRYFCVSYIFRHFSVSFSHTGPFSKHFLANIPVYLAVWARAGRVSGSHSGRECGRENIWSVEESWEEPVLALTTGCATSSVTLPS